ncbi:MAG: hypothetical protein V5A44_07620 [Haloarculaceae archaeon]
MVIVGMVVVVTAGAAALDETQDGLDTSRAEKALTQFDSRSAMVALGGTSHQGVDLAVGSRGGYRVEPEVGWMNVTVYNATADDHTEVLNVTLGAVVYENGVEAVAYQGGGVWKRTEAGVTMLSPPEFHFRDATLTLPVITVDGSGTLGSSAEVTAAGPTGIRYPNASADNNFTNPMEDGHVNVTVHSEYYEAWGGYFEQRTEGNVSYDHGRETARAKLVVPFNESYDNVVATTTQGGITVNGNDPKPEPYETGVNYPSADSRVEDKISTCESGGCDETTPLNAIASGGTYYADSDFSGDIAVTNPGANVTIVVNGDFEPNSIAITASAPHRVVVLVREDFKINSDLNSPGDAGELAVVLHSDGEFDNNGNKKFIGLIYAPGSTCDMNGGGPPWKNNLEGGIICDEMDINGNPNKFEYDPAIQNHTLSLTNDITPITYLHVTENPVNVTSG